MGQRDSAGDADTTLFLLLEMNVWRRFVDSDSESFKFGFDNALVGKRLVDVENDENQMASLCDGDDLTTTTFAVLCSLDDTRQIEDLNLCAIVLDLSGDGCELLRRQ